MNKNIKDVNGEVYDVIEFPGNNGLTADIGYPQLPIKSAYIEVTTNNPTISINSSDYIILQDCNIYPAQEQIADYDGAPIPPFEKDEEVYNTNQFYPEDIVKISYPLSIRGHKISTLVFFPVQYNPITKELKIYKNIDITINGAGSVPNNRDNKYFDPLLQSNVLNYQQSQNREIIGDLLIITPDEFYENLLPLKEWKERTGLRTKIITKTELENEGYQWIADPHDDGIYEGIDAYIKNAYDNWGEQAPEFLLLV